MFDFFIQHKNSWKQEVLAGTTSGLYSLFELMLLVPLIGVGLYDVALALGVIMLVTSPLITAKGMIFGVSRATILFVLFYTEQYGSEHLFLIILLSGIFQFFIGQLKFGKFIRLVPRSVYLGFLNGVSVLILLYILKTYIDLLDEGFNYWLEASFFIVTLALVIFLPKVSKGVPSILSVFVVGIIVMFASSNHLMIGEDEYGELSVLSYWSSYSLGIIDFVELVLPFSVLLAILNIVESLMAAMLVEELTGARANGNRETKLLGLANIIAGFFTTAPLVGSVTASSVNIKSGGKEWLSGVIAGVILLLFVIFPIDLTEFPLSIILAVQCTIFLGVFRWTGIKYFHKIPLRDTVTIVVVSGFTILTEIPAIVILLGVITSALGFAWDNAVQIRVISSINANGEKVYKVRGLLFFASFNHFLDKFVFEDEAESIIVDFEEARIVDHSGIEAIHKLINYYQEHGKQLTLKSLSRDSRFLLKKSEMSELIQFESGANDPEYKIVTDRVIDKYE